MTASDLRQKRILLGIKQCDVARQAGVSGTRLSSAENGYLALRMDEIEALDLALYVIAKRRLAALRSALARYGVGSNADHS